MMANSGGAVIVMTGLTEFRRALAKVDAQAADDIKHVLEDAAQPLARYATRLALSPSPTGIRRMTIPWAENRVGVTVKEVYIVPRKRGTKVPRRKRANLADLLIDRAYEPTRVHAEPLLQAEMERALDRIVRTLEFAGV